VIFIMYRGILSQVPFACMLDVCLIVYHQQVFLGGWKMH